DGEATPLQGQGEGRGQAGSGDHVAEVDAQLNQRLGNLGADTGDDALAAHQAGGGHRLEQVLRGEGVDRGHAGDVDDGDVGVGLDDPLEQALHDGLGPGRVERADDG